MSPVSKASQEALDAHTRQRRDNVSARIETALKAMRRENAAITIAAVARRASVTRPSIHRRPEILALIRAHQGPALIGPAVLPPPATAESSIVAALRARIISKDKEIADLKRQLRERDHTIAVLHGQLDRLHSTSGQ